MNKVICREELPANRRERSKHAHVKNDLVGHRYQSINLKKLALHNVSTCIYAKPTGNLTPIPIFSSAQKTIQIKR